jgi:AcrR family transcriptional regulator
MRQHPQHAQPVSPELQWIRPPRQIRTQEGLENLLDAAEALLADKAFDDVHVSEVAALAGSSVAAFYRRFKDKDALLHALHERLCEETFATADDALARRRWEGAGIAEIVAALIPFLIERLQTHEQLDRAIFSRAMTDQAMRERSLKLISYVARGLSELLMARHEEIHHPEPERGVSFALKQANAVLVQHYTAGLRDFEPVRFDDEQLGREIVTACLAYLGIDDPHAPFAHSSGEGRTTSKPTTSKHTTSKPNHEGANP